jgi:RNA polymerase sigma-70 factor, ECF subfamily
LRAERIAMGADQTTDDAQRTEEQAVHRALFLLIARAQSGDLGALDELLRLVQEPLYRHVLAIVPDPDVARDVLQDSLFTISRKLKTLRDPGWFRAWSYRIATREAIRTSRSEKRWKEALREEELAGVAAPESEDRFEPELLAALPSLLDSLSPASQVVLRMHYLEGLTHLEIAEALELALGTVKSRLAYGLARLRPELAKRESLTRRHPSPQPPGTAPADIS